MHVTSNSLSVWELAEDESNLQRVIAALAASRSLVEHLDYLVFDSDIPDRAGLKIRNIPGSTADKDANAWHRDLAEISGRKLLAFAIEVFQNSSRSRCSEKQILAMIKAAIERKEIDRSKLAETLLQKIDNAPAPAQT